MNTQTVLASLPLLFIGCGCHDHDHAAEHSGGHVHTAPHVDVGGVLVELGDHLANMELVPELESGTLTLYFWDGHAENPVRLVQESVSLELEVAGEKFALILAARASQLTGETVGDSAQFAGEDARLKGAAGFSGRLAKVVLMDEIFEWIEFSYPGIGE